MKVIEDAHTPADLEAKAKVRLPFLPFLPFLSLPAWPLSEQGMEPQKDANAHGTLPAIAWLKSTRASKSTQNFQISDDQTDIRIRQIQIRIPKLKVTYFLHSSNAVEPAPVNPKPQVMYLQFQEQQNRSRWNPAAKQPEIHPHPSP